MASNAVLLSQCEFLKLNQFKLELTEENRKVVLQIAEELLAGDDADVLMQHSAFLVEALFKFGNLSLAEQVARRRQADGLSLTAFDHLAFAYHTLDQYDFRCLDVHAHRPLYEPQEPRGRPRVLSFLYTTPVFQQNGYTVRTGSILANTACEVFPFGRIGYPWMSKLLRDNQKTHTAAAGGIEYHHRRGQVNRQSDVFTNVGLAKHEIKKIIAELRPDVVHAASNFTVGLPAMLAARECRLPFVYEMRGIWELTAGVGVFGWEESERFRLERRLETFVAQCADRVITLTETQKSELAGRGLDGGRIHVVPNFYEPSPEAEGDAAFAADLKQKIAGRKVIGYIGSIVNYEGLQDLVEVLSRRNPALDDAMLLIVGDGPYLAELKELVTTREMTDRVVFTGRVPRGDADAAYGLVDLCVLPRLDHPVAQLVSPLKLIEILAKGKVLLVSDVQAMAERVAETGYGELFRSGDVDDLERRIVDILADFPAHAERYRQAPAFVQEHHTWKQGAGLWDATLQSAQDEWRSLANAESGEPLALDALRSLSPPMQEPMREPRPRFVRLARATLFGPNIEQVVLHAPKGFDQGLAAVLFNVKDHTCKPMQVVPIPDSGPAARWLISAAGSGERQLYLYAAAERADQAAPKSWKLTTTGGRAIPLTLETNQILAIDITQKAGRDEALCIHAQLPQAVRFAMSVIPFEGATLGPAFEKRSFSPAIGARYQYVPVEPGEKLLPLKTGVAGTCLIELIPWQDGFRRAGDQIAAIDFCYSQSRAQSYFLSLDPAKHNVLVVARLNENLIDGSAIWLKTLVGALAANPDVNVYVATNAVLIPNSINAPMFSRPNVAKIDLLLPAEAREEALAAEVTLLDRISGGFDTVIIRGSAVAKALTTRSIRSRTVFYSVGLVTPATVADGICEDEAGVRLMAAHAGLIFQNELTRDIFLKSCPTFRGRCHVIPPSVDVDDLAAAARLPSPDGQDRTIVYAGKAIREYGILELLAAVAELRKSSANQNVRLVLIGSKFDGNDLAFQNEFHQLLKRLGDGVVWIPSASPTEVLGWVRRAQAVWGWRHGEFETSHYEVSTKMVEAMSSGTPIVLYPSPGNVDLMGADYEGFAETAEEAAERLAALLERGKHAIGQKLERLGARFISKATYHPLVSSLEPPRRQKRVLIASHDFRFIEDIEANFLRDGNVVHRQVWRNHTEPLDHGEQVAAAEADIVHCEWCLGNAVWWSNNLPQGKTLTIRLHLQEISTEFPARVNWDRVDRLIFISPNIMRQAIEKFSIPPEKCSVVPISVALQDRSYTKAETLARRNVLGMVGITPWRKRPDLALELFKRLKQRHPDLKLVIKGNMPSDYAWMKNRPDELRNYQGFFRDLMQAGTDGSVDVLEYDDEMQAFYERAGWVLSVSDFEGCHTAVAEGGILGSLPLMLNWAGADEVYPARYVRTDLEGLERAFDEWYARFDHESDAIQSRFVGEFGLSAVYARWAEILGTRAYDKAMPCAHAPSQGAIAQEPNPVSGGHPPAPTLPSRPKDATIVLVFSDAPGR